VSDVNSEMEEGRGPNLQGQRNIQIRDSTGINIVEDRTVRP
jgi:hypothetical protein